MGPVVPRHVIPDAELVLGDGVGDELITADRRNFKSQWTHGRVFRITARDETERIVRGWDSAERERRFFRADEHESGAIYHVGRKDVPLFQREELILGVIHLRPGSE